jgi:hypothetical protein
VFETFPQPEPTDAIAAAARQLDDYRRRVMLEQGLGLTQLYNRVHDPGDQTDVIAGLRQLHAMLDAQTVAAYGWIDLPLLHGFYETRMGTRYTIDEATGSEILDRLLELNHARYAREQAAAATGAKAPRKHAKLSPGQLSLVGDD